MRTWQDILNWFKANRQWYEYFKGLSQTKYWTQLSFGSKSSIGAKTPVSTAFQSEEDIITYFLNRIPTSYYITDELIAKWIVYNLLNFTITNDFLLAAKDVELFMIDDIFNVGALGIKYQTGWISSDKGHIKVSFVFWGKGDGQKQNLNKNRLQCLVQFLDIGEFFSAHANNLADCAALRINAQLTLQRNADKGWQRTLYTTWKDILDETRKINGIHI